jgi:hypothetical protein
MNFPFPFSQQQREERLRQEEQQQNNPRMDDENDQGTTDGSFQGEPPSYADVLAAAAQEGMRDNTQDDEVSSGGRVRGLS